MEHSPSCKDKRSSVNNSPHFRNPKSSLPHPQEPATVPVLSQISPVHARLPTLWRSNSIQYPHLLTGLQSALFPWCLPTKTLHASLLFPYMLYALPISIFSTWSPKQYLVNGTDHRAHYTVPSVPLLPRSSQAQIPSSASYSRTPYAYVPPSMWQTKFHTHMNQQEKL